MAEKGTVLVVDDNEQGRKLAGNVLERAGYSVLLAEDGEQCLALARAERPDVILLDRMMPGMSGDEVAEILKGDRELAGIKILMLSAKTSPDEKVAGLRLGADDYLAKPYNRQELTARINVHYRTKKAEDALREAYREVDRKVRERTVELSHANEQLKQEIVERRKAEEALKKALTDRNAALAEVELLKNRYQAESDYQKDEIRHEHNFEEIIGASKALHNLLRELEQVAPTNATVLILGESGTGKELVARAVHNLSERRERPLVKVSCAALPDNLIESELFGHEKGAFTGALERRVGRFELADRGTIFLDEVGDLPLGLQAKLLRVLQDGEFERLGNSKTLKSDVRVIAATNLDLEQAMREGQFREDLYYRLNVFPVHTPALRDRKDDIPALVNHFVDKYGVKIGKRIDTIHEASLDRLRSYDWPGNVRELENVVERAMILARGPVLEFEGQSTSQLAQPSPERPATMMEIEKDSILAALESSGWVVEGKAGAALRLGLQPSTLRYRMRKHGIVNPSRRGS